MGNYKETCRSKTETKVTQSKKQCHSDEVGPHVPQHDLFPTLLNLSGLKFLSSHLPGPQALERDGSERGFIVRRRGGGEGWKRFSLIKTPGPLHHQSF